MVTESRSVTGDGDGGKDGLPRATEKVLGGDGNVCFLNCSDSCVGIYPCQSSLRFRCAFLCHRPAQLMGFPIYQGQAWIQTEFCGVVLLRVLWFLGHWKLTTAPCWASELWLPRVCALGFFQRNSVRLAAKNLSLAVITAFFFGKWWNGQAPTLEFYIILLKLTHRETFCCATF